jgi:hypothetical protein
VFQQSGTQTYVKFQQIVFQQIMFQQKAKSKMVFQQNVVLSNMSFSKRLTVLQVGQFFPSN